MNNYEYDDGVVYEPCDENGNPIEDRKPKYTRPSTPFQERMLGVCGRKYFKVGEKGKVIEIERTMISLHTSFMGVLPTEWVDHCIEWAVKINMDYIKMTLPNLIKYIHNDSKRIDWVVRYIEKNKLEMKKRMDDDDGLMEVNFE